MGSDPRADRESTDHAEGEGATESLLEALLVEDAAIEWDPITGQARVARRPKPDLDRPAGSA